ncbi:RNA polymerase sigma-70 factor, ECF subfamily [Ohtaekwangia koreensis]|uniref:RNA polymerase sigma-70 factor, ECF subfamily n=2 Tax=Ohtaekwangia koreensis TaxID=688867 RepID=A0A1T5IRN8_9BACT|nr:RNA polymerase sigma-70 factor, ECF subfamily [Ohtaekwangia koreensis]
MGQSPDQEIIQAIQRGDKGAFEQVFHACYENLCQYAFTILKDMDEAEDIVQSMFLKIWERREDLNIQHAIRSYLFRAVYHQCINHLEHRTIKLKHQEYGVLEGTSRVQQPEIFPDELSNSIQSVVNELPQQCRIIFMMSRYEELRYAEIAQKLNISVNTIENQISKALRILRLKLKDHF